MQLTDEQQAIIQTNENIVINAVAGSGKTTTLLNTPKPVLQTNGFYTWLLTGA